jgi:hypothetical protein
MWIGANSFNIMHLETATTAQSTFKSAATELWLPWQGEMYFDLMGRCYHHKYTLTNYLLFDVDTRNKIKAPPPAPDQDH